MNFTDDKTELQTPQVKICGITTPETAEACVRLGADAIGCVFFAKSPRNISQEQAREICAAVSGRVATVGVFVNEPADTVAKIVAECGFSCAQLHGKEPQKTVDQLLGQGITVVKALFATREPYIGEAGQYCPSAYLVECGRGSLPGGNAEVWDWRGARKARQAGPLILAGGLSPDNVAAAIKEVFPDAVDVSSGVEAAPGKKDLKKVALFITAVRRSVSAYPSGRTIRRMF